MTTSRSRNTKRPQTGDARKASKAEYRRRLRQSNADLMRDAPMSIADAAAYLDVSKATAYRLIERGELVPVKVGETMKLRPSDLASYLNASVAS